MKSKEIVLKTYSISNKTSKETKTQKLKPKNLTEGDWKTNQN